jgi:hypothetical protein
MYAKRAATSVALGAVLGFASAASAGFIQEQGAPVSAPGLLPMDHFETANRGEPEVSAPALVSFTGGSLFATFQANGDTIGWSFTVNRQVIVSHLGY